MSYGQLQGLLLWLFLGFSEQTLALAEAPFLCDGSQNHPCLVQESLNPTTPVMYLRDSSLIKLYYEGDLTGIDTLKLSASAMPNALNWEEIRNHIHQQNTILPEKIIVIDLRQESHGYLNNMAITLNSTHNWVNLHKTNEQAKTDEENWLLLLKNQSVVSGVLTPQQFETHNYVQGTSFDVLSVQSEEDVVRSNYFDYQRFYVSDHRAPLDSEVDNFIAFYRQLSPDVWLHIHCRGGKGRTTTFLTLIDMLHNADKVSFKTILARQAAIPPFYDLAAVFRSDPDLTIFYVERLHFLEQFYKFAQATLQGYSGTWSEWKSMQ